MIALLITIFFGVIFAAGFNWLMTVESTNTDKPKRKKTDSLEFTYTNPATGLLIIGGGPGGVDIGGNPIGQSNSSLHHH